MKKERLKNQGKIHAKIGVNVGEEEAPVHCNAGGAKWARVRCNTLSKAQGGVLGLGKRIPTQKLQKRLNEITS